MSSQALGILYALIAFSIWGIAPIFWKQIQHIPASEALGHRILWAFLILLIILLRQGKLVSTVRSYLNQKTFLFLLASATAIALNWFIYVWAILAQRIIDTSLGYYMSPLVSILLGTVFLKEHLNLSQKISVSMAAFGVGLMTYFHGNLPWVSLVIAVSFGFYGLIRKVSHIHELPGLFAETTILFIPAVAFIAHQLIQGSSHFGQSWTDSIMLFLSGVITILPLYCFLKAIKLIRLSTVGIMMFLAPTTTFLLATLYYQEPFDQKNFLSYIFIWVAVLIYIQSLYQSRKKS